MAHFNTEVIRASARKIPWPRLGLELLVVFFGVYAASAYERMQERRRDEERRHQIRQALIREIQDITQNTRRVADQLPKTLGQYQAAWKAGRFPAPYPMLEPVRVENHMWNATLQSGALDLFDVPTVYELSAFYNELNEGFAQLNQLRDLSERMIVPHASAGAAQWYDVSARSLRPEYSWWLNQQNELVGIAKRITEMGDSAVAHLKRQEARS